MKFFKKITTVFTIWLTIGSLILQPVIAQEALNKTEKPVRSIKPQSQITLEKMIDNVDDNSTSPCPNADTTPCVLKPKFLIYAEADIPKIKVRDERNWASKNKWLLILLAAAAAGAAMSGGSSDPEGPQTETTETGSITGGW